MPKAKGPKNVFDLTARTYPDGPWIALSISADSLLVDFHRSVLASFRYLYEVDFSATIGNKTYGLTGAGSRTKLSKLLRVGESFSYEPEWPYDFRVSVDAMYEVPTRRHHPIITDGRGRDGQRLSTQFATWDARIAVSKDFQPERDPFRDIFVALHSNVVGSMVLMSIEVFHGYLTCAAIARLETIDWISAILDGASLLDDSDPERMLDLAEAAHGLVAQAPAIGIDSFLSREWCDGFLRCADQSVIRRRGGESLTPMLQPLRDAAKGRVWSFGEVYLALRLLETQFKG